MNGVFGYHKEYMERFNKIVSLLKENEPKLEIKYKNESFFMKMIGFILFFNPAFMNEYITTIGSTVYYTNKKYIEENEEAANLILLHEFVHIKDANKYTKSLFSALYLSPQILALLTIPLFFLIGWWCLFLLLFLAPIPSYFRMKFELDGYIMSLFALNLAMLEKGYSKKARIVALKASAHRIDQKNFRGAGYYFMWPFGVEKQLDEAIDKIISGDILENDIFIFAQDVIKKSKLI